MRFITPALGETECSFGVAPSAAWPADAAFSRHHPAVGASSSARIRIALTKCFTIKIRQYLRRHRFRHTDSSVESAEKLPHREKFHKRFLNKKFAIFRVSKLVVARNGFA